MNKKLGLQGRRLRLSFPRNDGPSAQILVNQLNAFEGMSRDFEFTIEIISDNANLELKALQGKLLCVELVRQDGTQIAPGQSTWAAHMPITTI